MMIRAVRTLSLLMLLLLIAPFVSPAVSAEDPYNRDCEGLLVVAVLCAGADAGANGACVNDTQTEVSCWYTYGWNVKAWSEVLPGEGRLSWNYTVDACIDGDCTQVDAASAVGSCTWTSGTAAEVCWLNDGNGGELDFVLALGQCVTVTATVTVSAEAWSQSQHEPLFHAFAEDVSSHGGAACALDDGR